MATSIIPFHAKYADDFKAINLEWLEKYNLTETHDLEILDDPTGKILDTGGVIFLAAEGTEIIGSAGLIKETNEQYELVKMAVKPAYQGKGIGKLLLEKCLEVARQYKAKKVLLFSNSKLQSAIALYEKFGFRHVNAADSPFETADVKMELHF